MKVAVLVSGMLRQFDIAVQTWRFKEELDCDFYFSTWNKSIQKNENLGIDIIEDVIESDITKHIQNANIQILNQQDYEFPGDVYYHNDKFLFHIKNSFKMMKESGIKYDYIMMTRSDNYKSYDKLYEHFLSLNTDGAIWGLVPIMLGNRPSTKEWSIVSDYFFFGKYEYMSNMIETIPDSVSDNIHQFWAHHFMDLNYFCKQIDGLNINVVRPNVIGLEDVDMGLVHRKFLEWGMNTGQN